MTTLASTPLDTLVTHLQETALLSTTNALLDWDQETTMPSGGLEWRARQQAYIARIVHERTSSRERGDAIAAVEGDRVAMSDAATAALVREAKRDYTKATKLPATLVEELARTSSMAKHEWAEARAASDFKRFAPWLEKSSDCFARKLIAMDSPKTASVGTHSQISTNQAAQLRMSRACLIRCVRVCRN